MPTFGQTIRRDLRPNYTGKIDPKSKGENGTCDKCRFAFRPNPAQLYKMGLMTTSGVVCCGNAKSSRFMEVITRPHDDGCTQWLHRHAGQPSVGDARVERERVFNVNLVKTAQALQAKADEAERQVRREYAVTEKGSIRLKRK